MLTHCQCSTHCLLTPLPSRHNFNEIELLFQLLRAFTGRFLCNMTFLKDYMEEEIPKNYSIAHKRALFFRFVEFNDPHFNDELKAKVTNPFSLSYSFTHTQRCIWEHSIPSNTFTHTNKYMVKDHYIKSKKCVIKWQYSSQTRECSLLNCRVLISAVQRQYYP